MCNYGKLCMQERLGGPTLGCVTVPEKGGVKHVVYIVSEDSQILITASVLLVYQGVTAGQRYTLNHTETRYMCADTFFSCCLLNV